MSGSLIFSGEMWLLYLDVADGGSWSAVVPRFVLRGDEFSFQFNGADQDYGHFSGSGSAKKTLRERFIGRGEFVLQGESPLSSVISCIVVFDPKRKSCVVEGTWEEERGRYEFELDLRLAQQSDADVEITTSGGMPATEKSSSRPSRVKHLVGKKKTSRKTHAGNKRSKPVKHKNVKPRSLRAT